MAGLARSTYFYHAQRLTEPDKHQNLKEEIQTIFTKNKQRFGYRRVRVELAKMGWKVSKKLVWKLMDQLNLKSKVRIRRKYSSYRGKTSHIAENLLKRQFQTNAANTK